MRMKSQKQRQLCIRHIPHPPVAPKQMRMKSKTSAEMGDAPLLSSRTSPARGRRDASSLFRLWQAAGEVVSVAAEPATHNGVKVSFSTWKHSPPTRALIL